LINGIGGCPAQALAAAFAPNTTTYFYEFADRSAPALNDDVPGYQWGAAHSIELAYTWPSYGEGRFAAQLTPAQQQLSREMVHYWGAFARLGAPNAPSQAHWPPYRTARLLSLRPGGQTTAITAMEYSAEHNCSFWNSIPTS
jgi:carboxylesterase type B